jgi:hypothetical protein
MRPEKHHEPSTPFNENAPRDYLEIGATFLIVTGVLLALAQSDLLPTQFRRWRLYELRPHLCDWPSRLKEMGYEIDFREQFIWLAPSVKIGVDFWADEGVEQYWIENITPCVCAGSRERR